MTCELYDGQMCVSVKFLAAAPHVVYCHVGLLPRGQGGTEELCGPRGPRCLPGPAHLLAHAALARPTSPQPAPAPRGWEETARQTGLFSALEGGAA